MHEKNFEAVNNDIFELNTHVKYGLKIQKRKKQQCTKGAEEIMEYQILEYQFEVATSVGQMTE